MLPIPGWVRGLGAGSGVRGNQTEGWRIRGSVHPLRGDLEEGGTVADALVVDATVGAGQLHKARFQRFQRSLICDPSTSLLAIVRMHPRAQAHEQGRGGEKDREIVPTCLLSSVALFYSDRVASSLYAPTDEGDLVLTCLIYRLQASGSPGK